MDKNIILHSSDKAAEYKQISGWVCANGMFWGENEDQARKSGANYYYCECGRLEPSSYYTKCSQCREQKV